MPSLPYEFQVIQKDDKKEVIQFIRDHFMKDEPINTSINLITDEKPFNETLEEFLVTDYDNGISMKAVQNGKLIGICINPILERNKKQENVESEDKDFLTIYNFLMYMDEHCGCFEEFPESDKGITVSVLAVHADCRGMGLARELMARALQSGKEKGCGFMTVECSSHYTALAVKKLGFKCIYRLPYEDYKVNGKIVFNTKPPHKEATVYVKKIE